LLGDIIAGSSRRGLGSRRKSDRCKAGHADKGNEHA
jgi:hypothetical protein